MNKLIFILLFQFVIGYSQTPVINNITENDGLPDYEIYDILEDHNGYIWLAANKGLYRYNGKQFVNYTHPNKRGLSVFGLQEVDNKIWCNNISGQFFYFINGKLNFFIDLNNYINGRLSDFKVTKTHLWALTEKGILKVELKTKKIELIKDQSQLSTMFFSPFFLNNTFYFGHNNNLKKLVNNQFRVIPFPIVLKTIKSITPFISKNRNLITVQSDKTYLFEFLKNNTFKTIEIPEKLQNAFIHNIQYFNNNYWISTNKGLFITKIENNRIYIINHLLDFLTISKIIIDKNQNVWASSIQNGLYVIPNTSIYKYSFTDIKNNITSITPIDNNLLAFGTSDGKIGYLNPMGNINFTFSLPHSAKIHKIAYHQNSHSLIISQDLHGYVLHLPTNKLYLIDILYVSKDFAFNDKNEILMCTYNSGMKISIPLLNQKATSKEIIFKQPQLQTNKLPYNKIVLRNKRAYTCAFFNNKDFFGYVDNLFVSSNETIKYNSKPIFATDIDHTTNYLWASTFENGILKIKDNKIISNLNNSNGLLSNYVNKLISDNSNLWISTDKGLQFLNTKENSFSNLFKSDGIDTYTISEMNSSNKFLYLLSSKELLILDKSKIFKKRKQPKVFIDGIYCNNKKYDYKIKKQFKPDENTLKISFHTTGYEHQSYTQFQYRINSDKDNWTSISNNENSLTLTKLNHGEYEIDIRIKYNNNQYSSIEKINIEIRPYFWNTWWFYLILLLTLSCLIYFSVKFYINKKERIQQKEIENAYAKQELITSQLENLRSQMNPHFIFNALNSIQEFIILNDKNTASEYLVKFSRLIRLYLEHSRIELVNLEQEILALGIYLELEKVRFEDKLDYSIEINETADKQNCYLPSLFVQPYVENALKHGLLHKKDNRILKVKFYADPNQLIVKIIDNGIGITASEELKKLRNPSHQSFANSANAKRVELINKSRIEKIEVKIKEILENNEVKGTEVTILIPQKYNE